MWTDQIQETLNCKKRGDTAFRAKDFGTAIECYTQVSHISLQLKNFPSLSSPMLSLSLCPNIVKCMVILCCYVL